MFRVRTIVSVLALTLVAVPAFAQPVKPAIVAPAAVDAKAISALASKAVYDPGIAIKSEGFSGTFIPVKDVDVHAVGFLGVLELTAADGLLSVGRHHVYFDGTKMLFAQGGHLVALDVVKAEGVQKKPCIPIFIAIGHGKNTVYVWSGVCRAGTGPKS